MASVSALSKPVMRKLLKDSLKSIPPESLQEQSHAVFLQLLQLPEFNNCSSPCIYLSMGGEIQTMPIVEYLCKEKKKVFVPKVIGPRSEDMAMIPVASFDEILAFPTNRWGIPEPPLLDDSVLTSFGDVDLVLAPGVAFDRSCNRLGHGKGYYDCFIDRLRARRIAEGKLPPVVIALALKEQIVEHVPVSDFDRQVDAIVCPDETIVKPHLQA